MDWECGINKCKLLHLEWINNKVLLYSTGNYVPSPRIEHDGKEYLKKRIYIFIDRCVCVCVCETESLCCTAEIGTIL